MPSSARGSRGLRAGPGRTPHLPPLPLLALLVTAGQLHIHAEIAVEVGLRAVEVEVADRDAAEVAADLI